MADMTVTAASVVAGSDADIITGTAGAGGICPVADVGTGEYASILGIAKSTTVLDLNIQASGVAL